MRKLFETSQDIADLFTGSEAEQVSKEILLGSKSHSDKLIYRATRNVYQLGNLGTEQHPSHAVMKIHDALSHRDPFEVEYLYQLGEAEDIETPKFAFIHQVGQKTAVIMEDVSASGAYQVDSFLFAEDFAFSNQQDFDQTRSLYFHQFLKTHYLLNEPKTLETFIDPLLKHVYLDATGLVVRKDAEFKRLVCANVDQLYDLFPTAREEITADIVYVCDA